MRDNISHQLLDNKVIMLEAWQKLKGYKRIYWGALGMIVLTYLMIMTLFGFLNSVLGHYVDMGLSTTFLHLLKNTSPALNQSWPDFLISLIVKIFEDLSANLLVLPMIAGFWSLCIRRSALQEMDTKMIFHFFSKAKILLLGYVFISLRVISVIIAGLVIPKLLLKGENVTDLALIAILALLSFSYVIFIIFKYMWYIPIIAEKQCSIREAFALSHRMFMIHKSKIISLTTLASLPLLFITLFCIPLITLGSLGVLLSIVLIVSTGIWILPWYQLVNGILYREIFG